MGLITKPEVFYDSPIEGEGHSPQWFAHLFYCVAKPILKLLFRYRAEGLDNLPKDRAVVIVANHTSMIDPVVLWFVIRPRPVRFLGKAEFFDNPFIAQFGGRLGAFPVKRESADRTSIKRASAALKRGEDIGIFPEGTRVRSEDQEVTYHAGAVLIAQMGKALIVPMGIRGGLDVKPAGARFLHFPKMEVAIGEPMDPVDYASLPKSQRNNLIIEEAMRRVFALRDNVPVEPRDAQAILAELAEPTAEQEK